MKVIVQAAPFFTLLSKQWTVQILYRLAKGESHFNELKRDVYGISAKVLSERLNDLELWNFVEHEAQGNKNQYRLTWLGKELYGNLQYLDDWLDSWFEEAPLKAPAPPTPVSAKS